MFNFYTLGGKWPANGNILSSYFEVRKIQKLFLTLLYLTFQEYVANAIKAGCYGLNVCVPPKIRTLKA